MIASTAIKFCGLAREADIDVACALAVDFIGLVLAADSPRRLAPDRAAQLAFHARSAAASPPRVVALLRNAAAAFVDEAIAATAPDLLQFHGDEDEAFCVSFGRPYWKAIGMAGTGHFEAAFPSAHALLLDSHAPGAAGGTGRRFDLSRWPRSDRRLVLAGGLDPGNVAAAVHATQPFAVDVSSGIEDAPGIKNAGRMRAFVAAVRAGSAAG